MPGRKDCGAEERMSDSPCQRATLADQPWRAWYSHTAYVSPSAAVVSREAERSQRRFSSR